MSRKNTREGKIARRHLRAVMPAAEPTHRSRRCLACEELLPIPVGQHICRACLADIVTEMVMDELARPEEGCAEEVGS